MGHVYGMLRSGHFVERIGVTIAQGGAMPNIQAVLPKNSDGYVGHAEHTHTRKHKCTYIHKYTNVITYV